MADEQLRNRGAANLTPYRKPESIWNRPGWDGKDEWKSAVPRVLAGIGGAILLATAI
jgi:hypothetical protein